MPSYTAWSFWRPFFFSHCITKNDEHILMSSSFSIMSSKQLVQISPYPSHMVSNSPTPITITDGTHQPVRCPGYAWGEYWCLYSIDTHFFWRIKDCLNVKKCSTLRCSQYSCQRIKTILLKKIQFCLNFENTSSSPVWPYWHDIFAMLSRAQKFENAGLVV